MEITIQQNSKYGLVVSSRVIAKELGKRHDNVIRDLEKILETPNVGSLNLETSNLSSLIIPSFYRTQGQKREYKEYLLTKDGFTLYMFNIQGYQDFKLAYINKFNEMEKELKKKEQFSITLHTDNFENDITQLRARANAIKREILEKRFLLDEKIQLLDKTGLTNHMEIYRVNGKIYICQDV